jgi:hypothetical protein
MPSLFCSPWNGIVAGLLLLFGGASAAHGVRRLTSGFRHARALDVVHGIRGSVIALAAIAFAGGVLLAQTGLLVLGAVFLGEELYETGLLPPSSAPGSAPRTARWTRNLASGWCWDEVARAATLARAKL